MTAVAVSAVAVRVCSRCGELRYLWEFSRGAAARARWCLHCKDEIEGRRKLLAQREAAAARRRVWEQRRRKAERQAKQAAKKLHPKFVDPQRSTTPRRRRLELLPKPPTLLSWTRGDCRYGPRPCPIVSCRHNNYLEVSSTGMIHRNWKCEPWEVPPGASCSLDIPDRCRGGLTLEVIAEMLGGLTRERIRQLEVKGIESVRKELRRRGLLEDMAPVDEAPLWRCGRRR